MGEAVVIVDDDEAEVADAAEAVEEVAEAVEAVAEAAEAVADAAGEVGGESAITEANALLELVTRELDQRLEPIVSRLAEVELRAGMAEITAEAALEEATVPDMPEPVEVEVTEDEVPPADQGHWYSKKRWFT